MRARTNSYGDAFEILNYRALNRFGQSTASTILPLDVTHINQASISSSITEPVQNVDQNFQFTIPATDVDNNDTLTVYFTSLPTPAVVTYATNNGAASPVIVGQPYPWEGSTFRFIKPNDGSYLGDFDFGTPYAFNYYLQDRAGATSAPATFGFNIQYFAIPPIPTGPPALVLSPGSNEISVPLQCWSIDGDEHVFSISSLPAHGQLIYRLPNNEFVVTQPSALSSYDGTNVLLIYKPDTNYLAGQSWTDSFNYFITNYDQQIQGSNQTITLYVNNTNAAPTLVVPLAFTNLLSASSNTFSPMNIVGLTIADDSTNSLSTARHARLTIQAVKSKIVTTDAGGAITVSGSFGNKITVTQPTPAEVILTGPIGTLNTVLNTTGLSYTSSTNFPGAYLHFTVEDLGWNSTNQTVANLSVSKWVPIVTVSQ